MNSPLIIAVLVVVVVSSQLGCGASQTQAAQPSAPSQASKHSDQQRARAEQRQRLVSELLAKADRALAKDQLMTPESDNALDRYRAILLLAPKSQRARDGVNKVAQRYCQLAYKAIQRGSLATAQLWLGNAEKINPHLVAIAPLKKQLAQAHSELNAQPKDGPISLIAQDDVVPLPRQHLNRRSESLMDALEELALKVKEQDSYVLIVTPNDADGRWVYQQMKQALPGYRLRGNIELGHDPKIVMEAPL